MTGVATEISLSALCGGRPIQGRVRVVTKGDALHIFAV